MTGAKSPKVNIVGGGIAGLLAAVELALGGAQVTVFEAAGAMGGRARTRQAEGYFLNQGPHALYRGGAFRRELDRLGIAYSGGRALASTRKAIWKGGLYDLPVDAKALLRTGLFGVGDKIAYVRILSAINKGVTAEGSFADWMDAQRLSPVMRASLEALARLSGYANGPQFISAQAILNQIRLALGGTLYLDGGWSSLVDGLTAAAREAGATAHVGARVEQVIVEGRRSRVMLADGTAHEGEATILALGPNEAAALAPHVASLQAEAREAMSVKANALDLALGRFPDGAHEFALGIDGPFYFSLHSGSAKLAPEGGAVVHVAKYLPTGTGPEHNAIEELEGVADLVMPGWRTLEVKRQELRGMVVSNALPRWDRARPGVVVADAPGLFIAGDWVGDEGMIADTAAASAMKAAEAVGRWLAVGGAARAA
jgi:phytoene dehydrogenase-like protein